jgi:Mg-chelatase subunit ChlD
LGASRLDELAPEAVRALTPLPAALERARRIGDRFRREHPGAEVDAAVVSDGRAKCRTALKRNSQRRLQPSAAASREPRVRQFG